MARRVIFVSGGGLGLELQRFVDELAGRVVQKPFDVKQLRTVVAEFIARASSVNTVH